MTDNHRRVAYGVIITMALLLQTTITAQNVMLNKQRAFPKTVPAGNYSGIAWIGGNRYAIVNDKSPSAGFYLMTIETDSLTGELLSVKADTFMTSGKPNRDEEGICYRPQTETIFISGEADNQVLEYTLDGKETGRRLAIPEVFGTAYENRGLEALTYHAGTHRFWITSESTLKADGKLPSLKNQTPNLLRLQSFGDDLLPKEQYWYRGDTVHVNKRKGSLLTSVSALAALDDGRLVVLERMVLIPKKKVGAYSDVKLYLVNPSQHQSGDTLTKTQLATFRTKMNLKRRNFAIYEGICVGPKLADGRQILVLVSDSQNQNRGLLKDWFMTVVVGE